MEAYYNWAHSLGMHMYTLPSVLLLAGMGISAFVHTRKQKKRDEEFNNEEN